MVDQDGARSTATGASIPPEVITGLLSDDGTPWVDVKGVKVPEGAEWICDYDRAVEFGLAITVPLQRQNAPIRRLFVVGVRASMDPAESRDELASVFPFPPLHPRASPSSPRARPPTTPTPTAPSGRAAHLLPAPSNPARPAAGSNGAVLADALGLAPDAFDGVDAADKIEQPQARSINAALWGPTWDTPPRTASASPTRTAPRT